MSADSGNGTRDNSPGTRQILAFFLVALSVGIPALWLGGPIVGYFAFLLFGLLFVVFFSGAKRRLYLVAYLLLSVWLLVGGLTYFRLTGEETAAQISSLPLIGWLLEHTAIKVGVAVLTGLIGGLLAVGLPLFLIIFISAEWMLALSETYGLDRRLAMKLLLDLALGRAGAYAVADEGEIKATSPKGPLDRFGAPVAVVVKPYNAVVLERGDEISRIEGAGVVTLQRHETVKAVVDLRIQGGKFEITALTKDSVPLTVSGSSTFRIESWQDARDRGDRGDFETKGFTGVISGPYPVYQRTLYRAIYGVGSGKDWQSQTAGMAGGKVGAAIRNFRLDEIFVADEDERVRMERSALQDIVDQAQSEAVKTGRFWGVMVMGVGIASIEMPEEVQEEFLRRWGAPWRGWQALIEAEAKRRVAVTEARGKQEVSMLQADATRWRVVTEALAKLEAATHQSEATVKNARARSAAKRIQASAEAEAQTVLFEELRKALEEAFGRDKAIEILKETVGQRRDIVDQIRKILGMIGYPYWRDLGSTPDFRQLGQGPAGREEESREEEPEEPE